MCTLLIVQTVRKSGETLWQGVLLVQTKPKEFYVVHSELKRLMLLVVLMLLVGGISSGVVLSQEEAEGGKEPAAVEEAEENQ